MATEWPLWLAQLGVHLSKHGHKHYHESRFLVGETQQQLAQTKWKAFIARQGRGMLGLWLENLHFPDQVSVLSSARTQNYNSFYPTSA